MGQPELSPEELRKLPEELARVDALLQDERLMEPFLRRFNQTQGRPGVPYTNEAVGAENYGTLAYIAESPLEKGVIWTGGDDGYVQVTRDGGATWKNVTPKDLAECLVNAIEVSPFDKGTAYVATTRYKFNDHRPGLYKTTDYGATWTSISGNLPTYAINVVVQDKKNANLLYVGNDRGVWVTFDGGGQWKMRVVPNLYPAFDGDESFAVHHHGPVHVEAAASGIHEVFVYTPDHDGGLHLASDDELGEMARAELPDLEKRVEKLERDVQFALLPPDPMVSVT